MKLWNVILATLVIFGTGVLTGALAVNLANRVADAPVAPAPTPVAQQTGKPQQPHAPVIGIKDKEFLGRLKVQLDLTTNQVATIEQILIKSNEKTRKFARDEAKVVREKIEAELNEEQRKKFEADQIKVRAKRKNEPGKGPKGTDPSNTNSTE